MTELLDVFRYSESGLKVYKKLRMTLHRESKCIFLAAMPKSGSSFLSRALAALTGFEHSYFAFNYANIEQELYRPKVIDAYGRGTVVQQHIRANEPNIEIFKEFSIRPIVLVRNVFDVVVSVRDHLAREKIDNLPSLYTSEEFLALDSDRQTDFIVDFVVPWYLSFYESWFDAERKKKIDLLWMVYEQASSDWRAAILQATHFCGIPVPEHQASEIVASLENGRPSNIRFNKGVSGRGLSTLSEKHRAKIRALASHYPWVDFARIGLRDSGGVRAVSS